MSLKYDEYLVQHCNGVYEAFLWMKKFIPDIFGDDNVISRIDYNIKFGHDASKQNPDEYQAYDAYFYGHNRSAEVVAEFNRAWLTHIHKNPHHWQHYILHKDDPNEETICIPMPDEFIVEMICDWWSFSWAKGNLFEIFDWYDERKDHIMLNEDSRKKVEQILTLMKNQLNKNLKEHISNSVNDDPPQEDQNTISHAIQAAIDPKTNHVDINDLLNNGLAEALNNGLADSIKNNMNKQIMGDAAQ